MMKPAVLLLLLTALAAAETTTTRPVPLTQGLTFVETFDTDPFESGRWQKSEVGKYKNQPVMVKSSTSAPLPFKDDKGVQLTQEMKHYGFGARFPEPIKVANNASPEDDFVVQYELKFDEQFNCGGAYVKLLRAASTSEESDSTNIIKELDSSSPYTIMFGPDRCGATNKIHFIVQYKSPVTGKWEEKHLNESIPIKSQQGSTHLYSLVIRPSDQQFQLLVDNKPVKTGSLLTHLSPAINPPQMIDDPSDKKPKDWVDLKEIDDATAVKPDDWDESQPRKIPDPTAKKPEGWLDHTPKMIPDPNAKKPEDWDDEEVNNSFIYCNSIFLFSNSLFLPLIGW